MLVVFASTVGAAAAAALKRLWPVWLIAFAMHILGITIILC